MRCYGVVFVEHTRYPREGEKGIEREKEGEGGQRERDSALLFGALVRHIHKNQR